MYFGREISGVRKEFISPTFDSITAHHSLPSWLSCCLQILPQGTHTACARKKSPTPVQLFSFLFCKQSNLRDSRGRGVKRIPHVLELVWEEEWGGGRGTTLSLSLIILFMGFYLNYAGFSMLWLLAVQAFLSDALHQSEGDICICLVQYIFCKEKLFPHFFLSTNHL